MARLGADFSTEWARTPAPSMARRALQFLVLRPGIRLLTRPSRYNKKALRRVRGPVIFVANHTSHLDTSVMLTTIPARFRRKLAVAAAADRFFDTWFRAIWWSFSINAVPIERERISSRSIRLPQELIRDGYSLIIFPEGGRSDDGSLQPFKPGAAFLAARSDTAVVPVYLTGLREVMHKGAKIIRPKKVIVTFGPPLRARAGEDVREFNHRIENAMNTLSPPEE